MTISLHDFSQSFRLTRRSKIYFHIVKTFEKNNDDEQNKNILMKQ